MDLNETRNARQEKTIIKFDKVTSFMGDYTSNKMHQLESTSRLLINQKQTNQYFPISIFFQKSRCSGKKY